jgi:hypothetical protein
MPKNSRRINKRRARGTRKHGGGRGRARRMRMKGGLGPNDSANIGLQGTYSFANPAVQQEFKMFTFGTQMQFDAWNALLIACHGRGVPVYILTSGNKVGIIRTLQLLGLADAFVEVLCTNPKQSVNPRNLSGQHNFQAKHKYQVIEQIMAERGLNCQGPPIGHLMDDGAHNSDVAPGLCPAIQFMNILSNQQTPPDYNMAAILANPFYQLNVTQLGLPAINGPNVQFNFTPIANIAGVTGQVNAGQIQILFVDFDQTLQIWEGAVPFEHPSLIGRFNAAGAAINVT